MKLRFLKIAAYLLAGIIAVEIVMIIICAEAYGEVKHSPHAEYLVPDNAVEVVGCGFRTVKADVLNIRSLPTIGGEVIGNVERGEHVYALMVCGDWALIQKMGYQFPSGWVHGSFLQ